MVLVAVAAVQVPVAHPLDPLARRGEVRRRFAGSWVDLGCILAPTAGDCQGRVCGRRTYSEAEMELAGGAEAGVSGVAVCLLDVGGERVL